MQDRAISFKETINILSGLMSETGKDGKLILSDAIAWIADLSNYEPKWIPISERLPASDDDVLVTNGIGMYIGWINPIDKHWRVDSESEYFMENIIAWMPLPKPYKPQESEEEVLECLD